MRNKGLMASIASFFVLSSLSLVNNASALVSNGELDDNGLLISGSRSLELSATIDAESLHFDITTSDLQTKTINVNAHTNNATGYSVSMNINRSFDYLTNRAMPMVPKINNISGDFSASDFPATGWGYSADSENMIFSPVPMSLAEIARTTTYGTNNIPVTIGVRAGDEIPAGTYENELLFTIIINPSFGPACNDNATTIENAVCMQDINEDVKDSMVVERQYQLYDSRDGKLYFVMKNSKGFVWMTQNLDLDLDPDKTFTYLDTNLEDGATWTPLDRTLKQVSDYDGRPNETVILDNARVISYDLGDYYFDYNKFKDYDGPECESVATCDYFSPGAGTHTDVGNLYTYAAAMGGGSYSGVKEGSSYNGGSDICPKGWEIPRDFLGSLTIQDTDVAGIHSPDPELYDSEVDEALDAPYHFTYSEKMTTDYDAKLYTGGGIAGTYVIKGVSTYSGAMFGNVFGFESNGMYTKSSYYSGSMSYVMMSVRCVAK